MSITKQRPGMLLAALVTIALSGVLPGMAVADSSESADVDPSFITGYRVTQDSFQVELNGSMKEPIDSQAANKVYLEWGKTPELEQKPLPLEFHVYPNEYQDQDQDDSGIIWNKGEDQEEGFSLDTYVESFRFFTGTGMVTGLSPATVYYIRGCVNDEDHCTPTTTVITAPKKKH